MTANTHQYTIEGMDCGDCARTIEKAVAALPGVRAAEVNFGAARLSVVADGHGEGLNTAIEHKVSEAGYRATPMAARASLTQDPFWKRERRVLTTSIGAVAALAAFLLSIMGVHPWLVNGLYALTIVVGGFSFMRAGLLALRTGRADMNLLMSVAAIGAAALGEWAEAATVVLLFAFGGTLQAYTLERTRAGIRALMSLAPETALVRRAEDVTGIPMMREIRLPIEGVGPGETVVVGPGERIPLDGVILTGESTVDQSPITGESVPVDVEPGAEVYAGSINGGGVLAMRILRAHNNTALARIIHLVEEAQSRRAPSETLVDRFAAIYTPVVIAGAVLIAIVPPLLFAQPFGDWIYRALTLLVVACPCALVISTPVSIVSALGAATRHGVLVKGGATLENLGRVRAVAFDKTGTLTQGRPQVVKVEAFDGDEKGLLLKAAAAEARSEHPLARAIVHAAREARNGTPLQEADEFKALRGLGAEARVGGETVYVGSGRLFDEKNIALNGASERLDVLQSEGNTVVLVGDGRQAEGVIALADKPRPEAKGAVAALKKAGVESVVMLTGDNPRTAAAIAAQVGVDEHQSGLLPEQKVDAVKALVRKYDRVAMVGDGVNDAPALATSTVGIAMGVAGTDAALEVADVALMSDDLSRIPYAVGLSRSTVRMIIANIVISLATKALALILASLGMLPLWGAIAADMGVSLLVTLNGMRLLAYRN
jgi:Cd2+/Zn2+-exporting ATPase